MEKVDTGFCLCIELGRNPRNLLSAHLLRTWSQRWFLIHRRSKAEHFKGEQLRTMEALTLLLQTDPERYRKLLDSGELGESGRCLDGLSTGELGDRKLIGTCPACTARKVMEQTARLTVKEVKIVAVLRGTRVLLGAQEVATQAGLRNDSALRASIRSLMQSGLVIKTKGKHGYWLASRDLPDNSPHR